MYFKYCVMSKELLRKSIFLLFTQVRSVCVLFNKIWTAADVLEGWEVSYCTRVSSVLSGISGRRSHAEHQRSLVMILQSVSVRHAVVHREIGGERDSGFTAALLRLLALLVSPFYLWSTLQIGHRCLEKSRTERWLFSGLCCPEDVSRTWRQRGCGQGLLGGCGLAGAGAVSAVLLLGRSVTRLIWAVTVWRWVSLLPPGGLQQKHCEI